VQNQVAWCLFDVFVSTLREGISEYQQPDYVIVNGEAEEDVCTSCYTVGVVVGSYLQVGENDFGELRLRLSVIHILFWMGFFGCKDSYFHLKKRNVSFEKPFFSAILQTH
jgi:hypothetical protein